jgi:hypothetical protein
VALLSPPRRKPQPPRRASVDSELTAFPAAAAAAVGTSSSPTSAAHVGALLERQHRLRGMLGTFYE